MDNGAFESDTQFCLANAYVQPNSTKTEFINHCIYNQLDETGRHDSDYLGCSVPERLSAAKNRSPTKSSCTSLPIADPDKHQPKCTPASCPVCDSSVSVCGGENDTSTDDGYERTIKRPNQVMMTSVTNRLAQQVNKTLMGDPTESSLSLNSSIYSAYMYLPCVNAGVRQVYRACDCKECKEHYANIAWNDDLRLPEKDKKYGSTYDLVRSNKAWRNLKISTRTLIALTALNLFLLVAAIVMLIVLISK